MRTIAVIVTYSDRFHLLSKVIESCLLNDINQIVVVDNNSLTNSKRQLKLLDKSINKLEVIWNNANLGSAKAFKQGLIFARQSNNQYILLLDDDNMLEPNAVDVLKSHWIREKSNKTKCLLAYRPDRKLYKKAIQIKNPDYVLGCSNSFYAFDIWDKISGLFKKDPSQYSDITAGKIAYAPFGGMFLDKSLIQEIGYPREDFFLYSDDHEWSFRIYKAGFSIELILNSRIQDLENSWALQGSNKKVSIFKRLRTASPFRLYYTIRNRLIFEQEHRVTNRFLHIFNRKVFSSILFLFCWNSSIYRVYRLAIKDALNKNLGEKQYEYFNS